jgi:hypothetical protein
MIYSVWNQRKRAYDYYETSAALPKANAPKPSIKNGGELGVSVYKAAWKVPAGAKFVGSGDRARGHVANKGLGGFDFNISTGAMVVGGLALLWWFTRKKR